MVLFKRKPVRYLPRPDLAEDQEIWVIQETGEIFTNYDDYLARMDFYRQKRFICQITGLSGLDFFTALKSQVEASTEVDEAFPEALREPILRKVQFSVISRIDNLVDYAYDEFRNEYFPGEAVMVSVEQPTPMKIQGHVREKIKVLYPEEDTHVMRYFVSFPDKPQLEAVVDEKHIWRDRKIFTKQVLRSFLKNSLTREAWSGAPWLVRDHLCKLYKISSQIPVHLTHEYELDQRKALLYAKKAETAGTRSHEGRRSLLGANGTPILSSKAAAVKPPPQPTGPPIKYPREDLDNPLHSQTRPPLKFLPSTAPTSTRLTNGDHAPQDSHFAGLLLETWLTLNVYCEVFLLDSFTFDDYLEALQFQSEDSSCELLEEIHCALLKRLVNSEIDQNGKVQIKLPSEGPEVEEDSDESESGLAEPPLEPPTESRSRSTRRSHGRTTAELNGTRPASEVESRVHLAAEVDQCVKGYGWKSRLQKRDLGNGRWIVIVVGLMHAFAAERRWTETCDLVLAQLAPLDEKPTEDTAISRYAQLSVELRVRILDFLCMLSMDTRAVRDYMDDCTISMTQFRKEKIEWQRKRKALLEDLKALDDERRELQPESEGLSMDIDALEQKAEQEIKETEEDSDTAMDSSDDAEPAQQRLLRRAEDRAADRKRRQEEDRARKDKAEADKAKKPTKEARQLEKVIKRMEDIQERISECEAEVRVCDDDLRESDCPRTRVLGKDRFWNRYYWFERNAMPYGGLPDSSTASAEYANGRLWVQGPDDMERQGFLELPEPEASAYRTSHGMTVTERQLQEEGSTHVFTALQWGYYDTPEELDHLIGWLSEKGVREVKLRKELISQRHQIAFRMQKRKVYLYGSDSVDDAVKNGDPSLSNGAGSDAAMKNGVAKRSDAEPDSGATIRMSTRVKATTVDKPSPLRCLAWHNLTAERDLGHLHSETPRAQRRGPARNRKSGGTSAAASTAVTAPTSNTTRNATITKETSVTTDNKITGPGGAESRSKAHSAPSSALSTAAAATSSGPSGKSVSGAKKGSESTSSAAASGVAVGGRAVRAAAVAGNKHRLSNGVGARDSVGVSEDEPRQTRASTRTTRPSLRSQW